jgi:HSP20 family protein
MKNKISTFPNRPTTPNSPALSSVGFVPFADFGRLFDRFFEDFGGRTSPSPLSGWYAAPQGEFLPRFELEKTEQGLRLHAELPGVSNEDLELYVDGDLLTLTGHKKVVERSEKERVVHSERHYGSFERRVSLPVEVDASKVTATFANGVLTVELPSKQPVETKRTIRIEAK